MSGRRSRNKGAKYEREIAARFREVGINAERCLTETRDGNVGDLTFPASIPLVAQLKVGGKPPIYDAVRGAVHAAGDTGKYPVAIVKKNGSRHVEPMELAVLTLDDFLELVATLNETAWR